MLSKKEQQLLDALAPRAEQEGVEIVTVEVAGAKKAPTIRVYIDTPDGVRLDPLPGAYTLEVSAPGIDRPLRTAEHFARFVGDTAVLKTQPVDGRGSWTGAIASVEGDVVVLDVDGAEARIPMDTIKRAHLKGTIDFGSQTSI